MDLFEMLPSGLGDASSALLVLLTVYLFYALIRQGLVPLMEKLIQRSKEQDAEREEHERERQAFYETMVIPHLKQIAENLQTNMNSQRELYEAKLAALERERAVERDRLVKQIEELTRQVEELTQRIAKLEEEAKSKEAELAKLHKQLAEVTAERDALQARLKAMEAAKKAGNDEQNKPTS